jgi:excisionase family DNA binding protein
MSAPPHDTLYGVCAIARVLGTTEEEALRLCESGAIPSFKTGKLICASKTDLRDWLAAYRAAAVQAGKGAP